jgi:hypothetical protein
VFTRGLRFVDVLLLMVILAESMTVVKVVKTNETCPSLIFVFMLSQNVVFFAWLETFLYTKIETKLP